MDSPKRVKLLGPRPLGEAGLALSGLDGSIEEKKGHVSRSITAFVRPWGASGCGAQPGLRLHDLPLLGSGREHSIGIEVNLKSLPREFDDAHLSATSDGADRLSVPLNL